MYWPRDCSTTRRPRTCVNGISDAVHHSGLQGKKKALALATPAKVAWLHEHAMLPLPLHQAYGTVLTKVKRRVVGVDPRRSL